LTEVNVERRKGTIFKAETQTGRTTHIAVRAAQQKAAEVDSTRIAMVVVS
jgi:hypothetical protein